jgi:hypothetical protein
MRYVAFALMWRWLAKPLAERLIGPNMRHITKRLQRAQGGGQPRGLTPACRSLPLQFTK